MKQADRIREMIHRLSRLDAAADWREDLNPTQVAVLDYLHRANRFSRSPSQVADYLGTTRGTTSQTLKSLVRKGYVDQQPSPADQRVVRFHLTDKGAAMVKIDRLTVKGLEMMPKSYQGGLEHTLITLLRSVHQLNGSRPFGLCRDCKHHQPREAGGFCQLLEETLTESDAWKICHEQAPS